MSRDEARHAGFINDALKDAGIGVGPRLLDQVEEVHLLQSKVHLLRDVPVREDRLRPLHHHLPAPGAPPREPHPPRSSSGFEKWCNDEFRHGEAFALLMHANPGMLKGTNVYWVRFFLLAVFAHDVRARPRSAGLSQGPRHRPDRIRLRGLQDHFRDRRAKSSRSNWPSTTQPFAAGLERLREISVGMVAAKSRGGIVGRVKHWRLTAAAGLTFAKIYLLRPKKNKAPASIRLAPALGRTFEPMSDYVPPFLFALFVWWFSTGLDLVPASPAAAPARLGGAGCHRPPRPRLAGPLSDGAGPPPCSAPTPPSSAASRSGPGTRPCSLLGYVTGAGGAGRARSDRAGGTASRGPR